ncbi:MAG: carbohydrate ABC transporter permease [Treponema sp.]|jgi:ABC-type glycerol-3-phosphate transport system permease component|nr:carbohydrate ABC transporter permease [Treponema sp.]
MKQKTPQSGFKRFYMGDRIFTAGCNAALFVVLIVTLYPVVFIVSASFSDVQAVTQGRVWLWPVDFSIEGYKAVFRSQEIPRGFINSVYITCMGTVINVVLTLMLAYPLSRRDLYGRNLVTALIAFTMLFSGGMIPSFLLVRNLGMYNTFWAVIIPGAVSVYNAIIARTFFQTNIPPDLLEAAVLDGCSDLRFLARVVLPLSAPIIAVLVMFYAVGHWNNYFSAMIYLKDPAKKTFQVVLRDILIMNRDVELNNMVKDANTLSRQQGLVTLLKYSLIVIGSAPMMLLYPFIQKHFIKGIMVGSIKG